MSDLALTTLNSLAPARYGAGAYVLINLRAGKPVYVAKCREGGGWRSIILGDFRQALCALKVNTHD